MSRSLRTGAVFAAVTATLTLSVDPATAEPSTEFAVSKDSAGQVRQAVPTKGGNPARSTSRPQDAAAQHTAKVGDAFGTVGEFRVASVTPNGRGSIVRTQQYVDSVPVYGGQIVQSLGADGKLQSASGAGAPKASGTFPANESEARTAAVNKLLGNLADEAKVPASRLRAVTVDKEYLSPALLGLSPSAVTAKPGYAVEVHGGIDERWIGFVDANSTDVIASWSLIKDALNRAVCDANRYVWNGNTGTYAQLRCGMTQPFRPARREGQGAAAQADVNNVYDFFGEMQSYYANYTGLSDLTTKIGADYGDGLGRALRGTVRMCYQDTSGTQCPWRNAFWNGEQMAFGEGVTTDDITGHELTHGVTERTNNLVYSNQSGAINESMSDIFGEFMDVTNGDTDDTAANRWLIGEGSSLGAIRNMKDPTTSNTAQPDKMSSPNWYTGTGDSGGVHYNSGVGNKAAYLISDGATFNGQTIAGIGIAKASALYWTVENLLTSSSRYPDLGRALNTACTNNVNNGVAGTTTADCQQVSKTVTATEMTSYARP